MTDAFENIRKAFDNLKKRVFVSEADFQHALAMKLEEFFPDKVRLEFPVYINKERVHIDIVIQKDENTLIPIELKYLTAKIDSVEKDKNTGIEYLRLLTNQYAQNINSKNVLRDIWRIEQLKNGGVCICITNNTQYWSCDKHRPSSKCQAFRLYNIKNRTKLWKEARCSFSCPEIKSLPDWKTFHKLELGQTKNSEFKYLYIEIPPKNKN